MSAWRTLTDVIDSLDDLDDHLLIYASADPVWSPTSPAAVCYAPVWEEEEEDERGAPRDKVTLMSVPEAEAAGMSYVLEVRIAKEVLEVWAEWRGGRPPSQHDKYAAVIHYATHDAYLPLCKE